MSDVAGSKVVQRTVEGIISTLQGVLNEQSIYFEHFHDFLDNIKHKNRPFSVSNPGFILSCKNLLEASGIIVELREIFEKIDNGAHQQFLGELDDKLQTFSTSALSFLADIIHTRPLEAIILGYEDISKIISCLVGNCSNQDDPELKEAITALDSALLSVDTRALSIHRILECTESLGATDTILAFAIAGSGESQFMVMKENLQGWIEARNLGKQTTPAAKGPDPALGG